MKSEYQAYKAALGMLVKSQWRKPPLSEGLQLTITFKRRHKAETRRFGDLDNLAKGVMDALNGIVFADDAQVTRLTTEKVQSAESCIEIEVAPL